MTFSLIYVLLSVYNTNGMCEYVCLLVCMQAIYCLALDLALSFIYQVAVFL